MSDEEEKALHAYENNAFVEYLMGRYPYYIPEAYMAPSNVPTNWIKALRGASAIASSRPDTGSRLQAALMTMTSSAEAVYCALATILDYLDIRRYLPTPLDLDVSRILNALSPSLIELEPEARQLHLEWMGPSTEVLWERIDRIRQLLAKKHSIQIPQIPDRG